MKLLQFDRKGNDLIVTKRNVLNLIEKKWLNFDWLTGIHWKEIKLESDVLTHMLFFQHLLFLSTFVIFVDWKGNDWILSEKEMTELWLKRKWLKFEWKWCDTATQMLFFVVLFTENKWLDVCLKNTCCQYQKMTWLNFSACLLPLPPRQKKKQ